MTASVKQPTIQRRKVKSSGEISPTARRAAMLLPAHITAVSSSSA
jgi:hypothetical protein